MNILITQEETSSNLKSEPASKMTIPGLPLNEPIHSWESENPQSRAICRGEKAYNQAAKSLFLIGLRINTVSFVCCHVQTL